MAVIVEAWEVIARRAAVEATFAGGIAEWGRRAPNRTACADAMLCRIGFMHERDATEFVAELERLGLRGQEGGVYRDVAIVGPTGPWQHACPWLVIGKHAGVTAAWWSMGGDRDPLVVPLHWTGPDRIENWSAEEAARRLRFVRREGNVDVSVDLETGREMYRGRVSPAPPFDAEVQRRFDAAVASIKPLLTFDGHARALGWFERRRLAKGIRALEDLTSVEGDAWRIWWFLGIARRSASDPVAAHAAFKRAYDAHPDHPDVAREYGGQCLALGKGKEAVAVSERNCASHPNDAGLRANLALAWMVAGDLRRAKEDATRAVAMDPTDRISQALAQYVDEVIAGRRPRPTTYP